MQKDNANPRIYSKPSASLTSTRNTTSLWAEDESAALVQLDEDDSPDERDDFDSQEVYDLLRSITDPEHPQITLEDLAVVSAEQIKVTGDHVLVQFTPTVPHCGMATLIGLSLRVRLLRALPKRFKVDIAVKEGTHQSENSVNKQLNDKERVAAALENNALLDVVNNCLSTAGLRGQTGRNAATPV